MEKELFQCSWCKEEFEDLEYWCDDTDTGWCSDACVGVAEERGMLQWESQQEDEGHE